MSTRAIWRSGFAKLVFLRARCPPRFQLPTVATHYRLRNREINIIFAVDLFNEGVDIPEVDTVLFLRPTESATVFLQQLGRGLRLTRGKTVLTALDFVEHQRREFRFDQRFEQ